MAELTRSEFPDIRLLNRQIGIRQSTYIKPRLLEILIMGIFYGILGTYD